MLRIIIYPKTLLLTRHLYTTYVFGVCSLFYCTFCQFLHVKLSIVLFCALPQIILRFVISSNARPSCMYLAVGASITTLHTLRNMSAVFPPHETTDTLICSCASCLVSLLFMSSSLSFLCSSCVSPAFGFFVTPPHQRFISFSHTHYKKAPLRRGKHALLFYISFYTGTDVSTQDRNKGGGQGHSSGKGEEGGGGKGKGQFFLAG